MAAAIMFGHATLGKQARRTGANRLVQIFVDPCLKILVEDSTGRVLR